MRPSCAPDGLSLLDICEWPAYLAASFRVQVELRRCQLAVSGKNHTYLEGLAEDGGDIVSDILLQEHEARDAARLWRQL